jgi:hypothetical protein
MLLNKLAIAPSLYSILHKPAINRQRIDNMLIILSNVE